MNLPDWVPVERLRRLALPVGGGLALLVIIVGAAWAWHRSQQSQGEAAFAAAAVLVQQASAPDAAPEARTRAIEALQRVVDEHPRFSGVAQAAYQLGNLRYAAGEFAAAREAYQKALAKGASPTLDALAGLGIGYTWEGEKNYANAIAAYESALKSMTPSDFLYEDALIALARAQELDGKPQAAEATYQRLLKDVPDTRRADDLKTRLATLKSLTTQQ